LADLLGFGLGASNHERFLRLWDGDVRGQFVGVPGVQLCGDKMSLMS
jgi:hypothetical protein